MPYIGNYQSVATKWKAFEVATSCVNLVENTKFPYTVYEENFQKEVLHIYHKLKLL